jgi:hypothetical protein
MYLLLVLVCKGIYASLGSIYRERDVKSRTKKTFMYIPLYVIDIYIFVFLLMSGLSDARQDLYYWSSGRYWYRNAGV